VGADVGWINPNTKETFATSRSICFIKLSSMAGLWLGLSHTRPKIWVSNCEMIRKPLGGSGSGRGTLGMTLFFVAKRLSFIAMSF